MAHATQTELNKFVKVVDEFKAKFQLLISPATRAQVYASNNPALISDYESAVSRGSALNSSINTMLENAPWIKAYNRNPVPNQNSVGSDYTEQHYIKSENQSFFRSVDDINVLKENNLDYRTNKPPDDGSNDISEGSFNGQNIFSEKGFFGSLNIVGQINNVYIVCESQKGMILIDQHAAHERVNYEKFKKQFQNSALQIQKFLFPEVIELSMHESAMLDDNMDMFADLGFELEKFGDWFFLLMSSPPLAKNGSL